MLSCIGDGILYALWRRQKSSGAYLIFIASSIRAATTDDVKRPGIRAGYLTLTLKLFPLRCIGIIY